MINPINLRDFADNGGTIACLGTGVEVSFMYINREVFCPWTEDKASDIELAVIKAIELISIVEPPATPPTKESVKAEMLDKISVAIAEHNGLAMGRDKGTTPSLAEYIYDAISSDER